jgi:hypothetical protein
VKRAPGAWAVAGALAVAVAGALAGCGSPAPATSQARQAADAGTSLATSLDTAGDSWAVVPMAANPAYWQVFARPSASTAWQLATPPGVASNGGLVAAGTGGALSVAFRPSQNLTFSPLASSTDGGTRWSTGLIDASVAARPGALAASGAQMLALLTDGVILASSDAGSKWRTLTGTGTTAVTAAGRKCGALGVTDVTFGISATDVLAAGTCGAAGSGVFAYSGGSWRQVSLPVSGRIVRMMPGVALVASGTKLYAAWDSGSRWPVSAPLATGGGVTASGSLAASGAWVLLPGGHAATIGGPGQAWRSLPLVPRGTAVLAAGPGGAVDALAVSGTKLTVWRLGGAEAAAWSKVQTIAVPIQYGSSS